MSISVIAEIPQNIKPRSAREMIRADIQEAIDKGVTLFEFVGDYNYKTLAGNARTVVKEMKRKWVYKIQKKFKDVNYTYSEVKHRGFYVFYKSYYDYRGFWISISSVKGEDHPRVFCKITDSKPLENQIIIDCEKKLAEARAEYYLCEGKWIRR